MFYLDYLALTCVIILTLFNRKALLFACAFFMSEILYYQLGFISEDGGLIYSAANAISFVFFTILAAALRFNSVLVLSLIAYWLLFFFCAIDYSLTETDNQFDLVFPWAIKVIDLIVVLHLYSERGPIITFNRNNDIMNKNQTGGS